MFSGLSIAQPSARRWTALTSFTLQAALVATLLVFPMLYPQNLPPAFLTKRIFMPLLNSVVQAAAPSAAAHPGTLSMARPIVVSRNSPRIQLAATSSSQDIPLGIDVNIGSSDPYSTMNTLIGGTPHPLLPTAGLTKPPKTSVVMEGNLIRRVEPQYPAIARQIRLQGVVVLNAIISRNGDIERVEAASGPSLLVGAAKEAVQQWKYRPYMLNGEPVEVETQITVNFVIGN